MGKMISEEQLHEAYRKGDLGTEETYDWWTLIWGVRSKIWSERELREDVRVSLGEMVEVAILEGNAALFKHMAEALEQMKLKERKPENNVRADIFFGVEELNEGKRPFTKSDLRKWVNKELETGVTAEEVKAELEAMGLAALIGE